MKRIVLCFLVCLIGVSSIFAQKEIDFAYKANEAIYLLKEERYAGLMMRMDPDMKRLLNEEKLMGLWDGLQMQFGPLKEIGKTQIITKDSLITTLTPIQFEKQKLGLKLVFNAKGEIRGIWLDAPTPQYRPAAYIDATRFYEYKKALLDPLYPAEAVITFPAKGKGFPVVIITGGSGATDKDLSMGPNKMYKDLAWGLAQNGVAVIRYDKRTKDHGAAMYKANKNLTAKEEYIDDLKLAISLVKKYPDLDSTRIFVLGHSEGGYLIPYYESQVKGIAGYVSFAGPYSGLPTLMVEQLQYLKSHNSPKNAALYDELLRKSIYARDRLTPSSPSDSLPDGLNAAYLLHLESNSPAKLISKVQNKPLLFIQGGRDYQVRPSEMELWQKALAKNPKAIFELYPKLNHLGLEGEGVSLPEEYNLAGNVPEEVILRIARFVLY
jgi:dienelactone hydrolase